MKTRIGSTLALVLALLMPMSSSFAGPTDFSVCSDLSGVEYGLCRAAIAIGCDVDPTANGCPQIAEQYERITGSIPPFFGASISPTSGPAGLNFVITDPQSRITSSDQVWFYSLGMEPTSGYPAIFHSYLIPSGETSESLSGCVPADIPPGEYLVSVLASDAALKVGAFNFTVTTAEMVECGYPPGPGR